MIPPRVSSEERGPLNRPKSCSRRPWEAEHGTLAPAGKHVCRRKLAISIIKAGSLRWGRGHSSKVEGPGREEGAGKTNAWGARKGCGVESHSPRLTSGRDDS